MVDGLDEKLDLQIKYYYLGKDLTFHITGGVAHIGAIATSFWYDNQLKVEVMELPHHKEGSLAKECAIHASKTLNRTVSVMIGIHIDNATKEEIEAIIKKVREKFSQTLKDFA